jgi:hypothetical protein
MLDMRKEREIGIEEIEVFEPEEHADIRGDTYP